MDVSKDWPVLNLLIRGAIELPGGAWRSEGIAELLGRDIHRVNAALRRLSKAGFCETVMSHTGAVTLRRVTGEGYRMWFTLYGAATFPHFELVRAMAINMAAVSPGLAGRIEGLLQRLAEQGCVLTWDELFAHLWVMRGLGELEFSAFSAAYYELRPEGL